MGQTITIELAKDTNDEAFDKKAQVPKISSVTIAGDSIYGDYIYNNNDEVVFKLGGPLLDENKNEYGQDAVKVDINKVGDVKFKDFKYVTETNPKNAKKKYYYLKGKIRDDLEEGVKVPSGKFTFNYHRNT